MFELGNEHGGHAVEGGGFLLMDGFQDFTGVEAFVRVDHGGPMGHAAQVAHDHAEAVVERHGDHQPVGAGKAHALCHEKAVVEDVVVGERGPLGKPRGAGGVLNVDRVVELQGGLQVVHFGLADGVGLANEVGPAPHAAVLLVAEVDDALQLRQFMGVQRPFSAVVQLGGQLVQHGGVVGALELVGGDQKACAGLVERVLQLVGPVRGVDVDQNGTDLGGGKLAQRPLAAVGCPDADPVAFLDPHGEQGPSAAIHLPLQFSVAPVNVLVKCDQRVVVRVLGGNLVELVANGHAQQGFVGGAAGVTGQGAGKRCR